MAGGVSVLAGGAGSGAAAPSPPPPQAVIKLIRAKKRKSFMVILRSLVGSSYYIKPLIDCRKAKNDDERVAMEPSKRCFCCTDSEYHVRSTAKLILRNARYVANVAGHLKISLQTCETRAEGPNCR